MFIKAQLVVKSYMPVTLEKGDWFVRKHFQGTDRESTDIFQLDKVPTDQDEFLSINGYPIEIFIIEEYLDGSKPAILATPEQIGWWDEDEELDEYTDISLKQINMIINDYNSFVCIDVDGDTGEPTLLEDKVILTYPYDYEEEDYEEMCDNCGSTDLYYNSSDEYICENCGYEENNEDDY